MYFTELKCPVFIMSQNYEWVFFCNQCSYRKAFQIFQFLLSLCLIVWKHHWSICKFQILSCLHKNFGLLRLNLRLVFVGLAVIMQQNVVYCWFLKLFMIWEWRLMAPSIRLNPSSSKPFAGRFVWRWLIKNRKCIFGLTKMSG